MGFWGCGYETASGQRKWLERDPIQEQGGINLYAFVRNNSLRHVDAFGLQEEFDFDLEFAEPAFGGWKPALTPEQESYKEVENEAAEMEKVAEQADAAAKAAEVAAEAAQAAAQKVRTPDSEQSNNNAPPATLSRPCLQRTYQTYFKVHPLPGQVYSGRTSGFGTPEENVADRDQSHHMNALGYGPAILDQTSSDPNAIRGQEQLNIQANGGAQSQGGTSGNAINGVSQNNPNAPTYLKAAQQAFGK
jgi:hypothetical protein